MTFMSTELPSWLACPTAWTLGVKGQHFSPELADAFERMLLSLAGPVRVALQVPPSPPLSPQLPDMKL